MYKDSKWQPIRRLGDNEFLICVSPTSHNQSYTGVIADAQGYIKEIVRPWERDYHDAGWEGRDLVIDDVQCHTEPAVDALRKDRIPASEKTYATVPGLIGAILKRDVLNEYKHVRESALRIARDSALHKPDSIEKYTYLDQPPAELAEALVLFQSMIAMHQLVEISEVVPSADRAVIHMTTR